MEKALIINEIDIVTVYFLNLKRGILFFKHNQISKCVYNNHRIWLEKVLIINEIDKITLHFLDKDDSLNFSIIGSEKQQEIDW